jgi:diamine N-acetyltransferase
MAIGLTGRYTNPDSLSQLADCQRFEAIFILFAGSPQTPQLYNMENQHIILQSVTAGQMAQLVDISRQTFLETFGADNTAEDMQLYLDNNFSSAQLLAEINNPASEFYFALLNEVPVGYLKLNFGNAQTELQTGNTTEIERIYVLQQFQGHKIGQFLFNKAIEMATTRQAHYIWLGVWEHNTKAIQFYQKNGFEKFDTHVFTLGKDEQTDWLMKRVLNN